MCLSPSSITNLAGMGISLLPGKDLSLDSPSIWALLIKVGVQAPFFLFFTKVLVRYGLP